MKKDNPKSRQQWIYDLLISEPTLSFAKVFSEYSVKFSKSEKTFSKDWKQAQARFTEYQNKVNKEKEKISIQEETKAVKKGLKVKFDRLMNLQNLVDNALKDLSEGMTDDVFVCNGVVTKYRRKMNITELNNTRKAIKDIQAEISKIEGDYAPKEVVNEVKMPNPKIILPEGKTFDDILKEKGLK